MKPAIIEIKNLIKQYPGAQEQALRGLDLSVQQGEFFGLLGPNGSGKTTTISILCGLIQPTSGNITIAGHSIPVHLNAIKPLIGLVPQEIALYPNLSFKENVSFFGRLYGLKGRHLRERIDYCIEVARLNNFADKLIKTYSGGMKRRANLAVSLLHEPQLIFLDEPTVNVDPQSRNVIFDILQVLNKAGTSIMYTTHYLEEAQQYCSRVAIMDLGKIICQGSPAELIAQTPDARDLGEVFLNLTGRHLRD